MKKLSTTEFILDLQNKFDKLTISLDKITEKNNNDLNNTIKEEILRRFDKNIRNRVYHKKRNQRHCGSEGYC